MRVVGVEAGIGSMLDAAREVGCTVLGNIESRSIFHIGVFEYNFPESFFVRQIKSAPKDSLSDIDLLLAQPEYRQGYAVKKGKEPSFSLVVEAVTKISPRFFLVEVPIKAFIEYNIDWWVVRLPEYRLDVDVINHYGYGNTQVYKSKAYIIGRKRDESYVFVPGEEPHNNTVKSVIEDLLLNKANVSDHSVFPMSMPAPGLEPLTVREAIPILAECVEGEKLYCVKKRGNVTYIKAQDAHKYPGSKEVVEVKKLGWDTPCYTLPTNITMYHPIRNSPLTCRERARLVGFSDSFKFVFNTENAVYKSLDSLVGMQDNRITSDMVDSPWLYSRRMGVLTGTAAPTQFTKFFCRQLEAHIEGKEFKQSGKRFVSHYLIEWNKHYICSKEGKGDCEHCVSLEECSLGRTL